MVVEGPGQGLHFPLAQPLISVAREDTCTFQILDGFISRTHLQVRPDPATGKHVAADYRSSHGACVNDKQIMMDSAPHDGDRIKIGNTTLMYLVADHADVPAALAAAKEMGEWKRSTLMHKP